MANIQSEFRTGSKAASVELSDVHFSLPIYEDLERSIRFNFFRRASNGFRPSPGVFVKKVIKGLSASFLPGDRVALIGNNGAGKSTLLRLIAGIYQPQRGFVSTSGRISSLFDFSAGMDENSSGLLNIQLRALMMGIEKAKIRSATAEIIKFSGLGDSIRLPLRTYSSGMKLRLAFSICTAFDSDILLLDEVMGVGDLSFREKAVNRLESLIARSSIVFHANHDLKLLMDTCNKALYLSDGDILFQGNVAEAVEIYQRDQ